MVNISSNYEYITKSQARFIESNIPEKLTIIQDNLLDFKMLFENMEWTRGELERIARELESMGRYFIQQESLEETGALLRGTKAEVSGNKVNFFNDARNSRGQFYAGHHEYGFYARNGRFIEARPFMRPALFAVSKASQGDFANILAELAMGVFNKKGGYQGLNSLQFGKELGSAHSFSKKTNIIRNKVGNNYHADYLDKQRRVPFSIRRGRNDNKTMKKRKDVGLNERRRNSNKARDINKIMRLRGSKPRLVPTKQYRLSKRYPPKKRTVLVEEQKYQTKDGKTFSSRSKAENYLRTNWNKIKKEERDSKITKIKAVYEDKKYTYKKSKSRNYTLKKRE